MYAHQPAHTLQHNRLLMCVRVFAKPVKQFKFEVKNNAKQRPPDCRRNESVLLFFQLILDKNEAKEELHFKDSHLFFARTSIMPNTLQHIHRLFRIVPIEQAQLVKGLMKIQQPIYQKQKHFVL
ncbi:uncharacterized protein LOC128868351 [Anastrepha ludens]|uniref:uncharacterized protein LOC128868351 n=1 Tax=Anastrepha ludens TaxID=28586 RepID=UPI0023B1C6A8|nr:uncharacterized protein LOC128868351 [Anastrepha ludens]